MKHSNAVSWSPSQIKDAFLLKEQGLQIKDIGNRLGRTPKSVERALSRHRPSQGEPRPIGRPKSEKSRNPATVAKRALAKGPVPYATLRVILEEFSPKEIERAIAEIGAEQAGALVRYPLLGGGKIDLRVLGDKPIHVGLVADTHLCSTKAREDILHLAYDHFEKEGIKQIFHAGNMVDGYVPRINGGELLCTSIDDQTQFVIDNYPRKKGINTYFITGDDHEGWWQKEGFNWGSYLELLANNQGRADLHYLGHVEADVDLVRQDTGAIARMKIQHPGGGSSYAKSYHQQKQAESLQGGEKPAILVQGHHHLYNKTVDRNIHMLQIPGMQDQTIFGRKKRLRFEVGFVILEIYLAPDGAVARLKEEAVLTFDRGYYQRFLKSDKQQRGKPIRLAA